MLHVHQQGVGICGVFTYEIAETKVGQVIDFAQKNQHPAAMYPREGITVAATRPRNGAVEDKALLWVAKQPCSIYRISEVGDDRMPTIHI